MYFFKSTSLAPAETALSQHKLVRYTGQIDQIDLKVSLFSFFLPYRFVQHSTPG